MVSANFEIEGLDELEGKFDELTAKLGRAVLRNAFRKAGRVIEKEARLLAPKDDRDLERGIGTSVSSKPEEVTVDVGVRLRRPGAPARYYGFQELGTAHHAAHPFLRPALDNKGAEAVRVIASELVPEIRKIAAKHGL